MMASIYDIEQDYFHWLCEMVRIETEDRSYWLLAKDLHRRAFYPLVDHDENRASDGLELREEYLREVNYPKYYSIEGDCSVLEMIIALARRIAFETSDPYDLDIEDDMDRTCYWFWEMMRNLGLDIYDDENYVENSGYERVEVILSRFLDRDYKRNGDGGLFPLDGGSEDQRDVEIWYQMNAYLMEKDYV